MSRLILPKLQTYHSIGLEAAQAALDAVCACLRQDHKAAVAAVADAHGELVALSRMDGAPTPSILIASNKAWTAARLGMDSSELGHRAREEEWSLSFFGDPRYVGWGGGVPVRFEGQVVGAFAVSGLSQEEDEHYALLGVQAALEALMK